MYNKKIILLLFCLLPGTLFSQGFDWQYSARLPASSPVFFLGLTGDANYLQYYGNIVLQELNKEGVYVNCCIYKNGSGSGTSVGLQAELWDSPGLIAYYTNLTYSTLPGSFQADGEPLPYINTNNNKADTIHYINKFTSNLSYFFLEMGGKVRLLHTHFHIGLGLKFGFMTSSRFSHTESITSPDQTFNDGTQVRTVPLGKISDIQEFVFSPRIRFGYDVTFGLGFYATPLISIGLPIINISKTGQWETWDFSFGITVYKGLF